MSKHPAGRHWSVKNATATIFGVTGPVSAAQLVGRHPFAIFAKPQLIAPELTKLIEAERAKPPLVPTIAYCVSPNIALRLLIEGVIQVDHLVAAQETEDSIHVTVDLGGPRRLIIDPDCEGFAALSNPHPEFV